MLLEDGQKEFKSAELNSKAENVHRAKYLCYGYTRTGTNEKLYQIASQINC